MNKFSQDLYWVCQEVHLGFSISYNGCTQMNVLGKPIETGVSIDYQPCNCIKNNL